MSTSKAPRIMHAKRKEVASGSELRGRKSLPEVKSLKRKTGW
jgi:hypothetical protein